MYWKRHKSDRNIQVFSRVSHNVNIYVNIPIFNRIHRIGNELVKYVNKYVFETYFNNLHQDS